MKYKVGDKVRVKSIEWYDKNKEADGPVKLFEGNYNFIKSMSKYCGRIVTICRVDYVGGFYDIVEDNGKSFWTDEMFEGKIEEQIENKSNNTISKAVSSLNVDINIGLVPSGENRQEIVPSSGYKIVKEDCKYFLVKTTYPKTCIDCCEELGLTISMLPTACGYKSKEIDALQKLIVCRDAYRKIAGEEMGLGKPWEPKDELSTRNKIYDIRTYCDTIQKGCTEYPTNRLLSFPTEEMRDAFFENFKHLIEQCKEFL